MQFPRVSLVDGGWWGMQIRAELRALLVSRGHRMRRGHQYQPLAYIAQP